jgi:hypothetical protein
MQVSQAASFLKQGKTVALIKAFTRLSRAGNAIYRSRKFKRKVTVNKWI